MTKFHRFLFKLWRFYMWLNNIRPQRTVYTCKTSTSEIVSGTITSLSGESITTKKYGFDINIQWDKPLQGNSPRYYTSGSYKYKDFISGKLSV